MAQSVDETLKERARYGDYRDVAASAQRIKRAMQEGPGWATLSDDKKESLDMIANKIARIISGGDSDYADNWHDIGGYAKLAEDRCRPQALHEQLQHHRV